MPVYNAERYLEECINSILKQTEQEWELLAIDDFSVDKSFTILQSFQEKDCRIKVFKNKTKGIIPALSLAFEQSSGQHISRMDADDIMNEKKLELLKQELIQFPTAIITSKVHYFSEDGISDGYKKYEDWLNSLMVTQSHYSEIYKECVLPSPNWMMHRATLTLLGGFKTLAYPEDYDLCFKAYQQNIQIRGLANVLHKWRDYGERTSRNDPNYSDNRFIPLKVKYFSLVDYQKDKQLILWGAGKKGKVIAKLLSEKQIRFKWCTNNPNKINHEIYGVILENESAIELDGETQLIVAIADQSALQLIAAKTKNAKANVFWFC